MPQVIPVLTPVIYPLTLSILRGRVNRTTTDLTPFTGRQ